jgi:hypothetical protein
MGRFRAEGRVPGSIGFTCNVRLAIQAGIGKASFGRGPLNDPCRHGTQSLPLGDR